VPEFSGAVVNEATHVFGSVWVMITVSAVPSSGIISIVTAPGKADEKRIS